MTVKERLIKFIDTTGFSHLAFQKHCNLPNGYVNNIRRSVGPEAIKKIKDKYPNLNELWLLHGQEPMILNQNIKTQEIKSSSVEAVAGEFAEELIRVKAALMVLEQMVDLSVSQQTGETIGVVSGGRRRAVSMEIERLLSEWNSKNR